MSRSSDAANAVINAAEQVLDLYGVQHSREQSRVLNMKDDRDQRGYRPMYFGKWIDDEGKVHASGRADILARPKIQVRHPSATVMLTTMVKELHPDADLDLSNWKISIPLWIECKSGKGKLTPDQVAFRHWVVSNGDAWLLIHDDINPLIDWLKSHNVSKQPKRVIHAEPMTTDVLDDLPCKHCGGNKFTDHTGTIHACKATMKASALGKVWSPKLTTSKAR